MATIGPRSAVDAPRPQVWRPGLVRAARSAQTFVESPVNGDIDAREAGVALDRWANGIAYRPELAFQRPDPNDETARIDGPNEFITCPVDTELDQADKTAIAGDGVVEWDPYALWDADTCTTLSSDYEDTSRRVTDSLTRQTSHMLENVLWTGTVNGIDFTLNHPNTALASGDATLPNGSLALGVVEAFSLMTESLSDLIGGIQGMIHVPAHLIPYLDFYGLITRVDGGTNFLFAGDHMIVTGTGYPGTGPSGQDGSSSDGIIWIYGTSFVRVWLSGVFPIAPIEAASVVKDTNDIEVRAERMALAEWDRTAHVGIPVCVPDPGPACETSS